MRQIPPVVEPPKTTRDPFHARIQPGEAAVLEVGPGIDLPTGPIEVVGARSGDAIAVSILEISVRGGDAVTAIQPGAGLFGERFADRTMPWARRLRLSEGWLEMDEGFRIPLRPVVGLVETMPLGEPVSLPISRSFWPWRYGGDFSCCRITAGSTIYLPVEVPGAGLSIGNLLAAVGDGALVMTGAQAGGEVTVRVDVLPGRKLRWPVVESSDEIFVAASARTMAEAAVLALDEMARLLELRLGLTFEEAGMVLSLAGDVRPCQAIHPYVTVRAAISKAVAAGLEV